jgi:hypothetical protein
MTKQLVVWDSETKQFGATQKISMDKIKEIDYNYLVNKPLIISDIAPTDTTLLWYDTQSKQIKYYDNGVWVAITSSSSTSMDYDFAFFMSML